MDVTQIEVLLNKIEHAVKIIQQLKEKEAGYESRIAALTSERDQLLVEKEQLESDREHLAGKVQSLQSEIDQTDQMHAKLEGRIKEILNYLPDEEVIDQPSQHIDSNESITSDVAEIQENEQSNENQQVDTTDNHNGQVKDGSDLEMVNIENDEQRIKEFVTNPEEFENKNLFNESEGESLQGNTVQPQDQNNVSVEDVDAPALDLTGGNNSTDTLFNEDADAGGAMSENSSINEGDQDALTIIDDQAQDFPPAVDDNSGETGSDNPVETSSDSSTNEVSVEFAGTLIDDESGQDLEFSFEDNDTVTDLPRGVL
jgi:hypothetical protein